MRSDPQGGAASIGRGTRSIAAIAASGVMLAMAASPASAAGGAADGVLQPSAAWRFEPAGLGEAYAGRLGPRFDGATVDEAAMAESSEAAAEAKTVRFGEAGSWRFNAVAGAIASVDSAIGGQFRIEFEHFLIDRFSLVLDLELTGLSQKDAPSAAIAGGGLMLRWHFLEGEGWTVFADAGCGLAYASTDVPPGTNRIKFSPQAGAGFTLAIDDPLRLVGGVRWYHLSNARVGDTNDGFDAVMAYLGLSIGF